MPTQGLSLEGLSLEGSRLRRWLMPVAAAIVLACSALSARAADFYAGKTLTMIVGFAPGGGVDTTARVVGRHLVRFIPGAPTLLVQNMEGAAGLVAMNYLSRRVAADGLTIAMPGRSWYVEGALRESGRGVRRRQAQLYRQPRRGEFRRFTCEPRLASMISHR